MSVAQYPSNYSNRPSLQVFQVFTATFPLGEAYPTQLLNISWGAEGLRNPYRQLYRESYHPSANSNEDI